MYPHVYGKRVQRSATEIIAMVFLAGLLLVAFTYVAERSLKRASERARARALVDARRTDYPIVYEWGPNLRTWGPSYRVVINEDSFTSDLAGVRFGAPIASIWRVTRGSRPKGGTYWRVLCHAESAEPQGLALFGGGICEVVARVLAHKAGVDVVVEESG